MKKQRRKKTARIYYGMNKKTGDRLYWTVRVKDAKQAVDIDGTLLDAIMGERGSTIGCHLSNCGYHNTDKFPHPFKLASFTRSTCLVVTKITHGTPSHAVKYSHSYANLVEINDKKLTKGFIRRHPELAERTFTLRPPRAVRPADRDHTSTGATNYNKRAMVPRGALRRAIDAKLVSPGLVKMGYE